VLHTSRCGARFCFLTSFLCQNRACLPTISHVEYLFSTMGISSKPTKFWKTWRAAPAEEKKFLQGLVQLAVAFHHHSTGNRVGMRSVMERGMRNLGGQAEGFCGIELAPLMESLTAWRAALENGQALPPLPRIELKS